MKTADRENPNRWAAILSNRARGAKARTDPAQSRGLRSKKKLQPSEVYFFLTPSFIELTKNRGGGIVR